MISVSDFQRDVARREHELVQALDGIPDEKQRAIELADALQHVLTTELLSLPMLPQHQMRALATVLGISTCALAAVRSGMLSVDRTLEVLERIARHGPDVRKEWGDDATRTPRMD